MMKIIHVLTILAGAAIAPTIASAEMIFGLDIANRIYHFDSATPSTVTFLNGGQPITGLQSDETLLGIDFRPVPTNSIDAAFNGLLYGLSVTSAPNAVNRLYTIDTKTGAATPVGTAGGFTLNGNAFGVDFDPYYTAPLRVVSDLDQNLRLNANDGTLIATDTPLAYVAGDPNFGVNPNIVGIAYMHNFGGGMASRPFGIDSGRDVLVRHGTGTLGLPDNGQLTTIGALGVDTIDEVGFDISGASGVAYASLTSRIGPLDTSSDLYTINLTTGAATLIGSIGQVGGPGAFETRDIAAPVGTPIPEPEAVGLIAGGLVALVWRRRLALSA